jgi:fructokinase
MLPSGPRLGGASANFAVLGTRLGEFGALVSCIGADELGRDALARLQALGTEAAGGARQRPALDLSAIQTSARSPTGSVAVAFGADGQPRYTIAAPAAWDDLEMSPAFLDLAGRASAICFGTLAQRHEPSRRSIRAFLEAANPQCLRVCDLNLRAPYCSSEVVRWCIGHADVLKVSDEELPSVARLLDSPELMNEGGSDAGEVAALAARHLLGMAAQCRLVAITLGPQGSLLADRSGTHRHPGLVTKVVDTVGAGDAFTAGLVHAYLRGGSLEQMSEVANRCGAYVASQPGATPELPESLLETIRFVLEGDSSSGG